MTIVCKWFVRVLLCGMIFGAGWLWWSSAAGMPMRLPAVALDLCQQRFGPHACTSTSMGLIVHPGGALPGSAHER